jgi:hypothetical protein
VKILLTEWQRDWATNEAQHLKPVVIDLNNDRQCLFLIVSLGNGNYYEVCFECDSVEAQECLHGLLTGTGGAKRVQHNESALQCKLYRSGYHFYVQGDDAYFFVNPVLDPQLIENRDFENYLNGFAQLPAASRP